MGASCSTRTDRFDCRTSGFLGQARCNQFGPTCVVVHRGHNTMDDGSLTADLRTDLDTAFERLVRCYQDRIYCFSLRLSASREEAEEITQDAFVRAYQALSGYSADRIETLA